VGLKPTRGRNTMAPYLGEGLGGLSAEHAVTLSVRDSAALLDATCGRGAGDPYAAPPPARPFRDEVGAAPGTLRIAWTSQAPNGAKLEAESLRVLGEAARPCAQLGHRVEQADPAIDRAAVVPTLLTLASANTVVNLASQPTKLGWIDRMMDEVDEYWQRVFTFSPFTMWFNITGQPAMMQPLGHTADGLPVAVQIVARYGDEATLFRLAAARSRASLVQSET